MGGEWFFQFKKTENFNIEKYQKLLTKLEKKINIPYERDIENNIFAKFTYTCTRHSFHNKNIGSWIIYYNPNENYYSDLHARCNISFSFNLESVKLQRELQREFPNNFELYLGDGINGHNDEYYDYDNNIYDNDNNDFTACGQDCGYCGNCEY